MANEMLESDYNPAKTVNYGLRGRLSEISSLVEKRLAERKRREEAEQVCISTNVLK